MWSQQSACSSVQATSPAVQLWHAAGSSRQLSPAGVRSPFVCVHMCVHTYIYIYATPPLPYPASGLFIR